MSFASCRLRRGRRSFWFMGTVTIAVGICTFYAGWPSAGWRVMRSTCAAMAFPPAAGGTCGNGVNISVIEAVSFGGAAHWPAIVLGHSHGGLIAAAAGIRRSWTLPVAS